MKWLVLSAMYGATIVFHVWQSSVKVPTPTYNALGAAEVVLFFIFLARYVKTND